MFLLVQFPFADVRRFACVDGACLRSPTWPDPEVDRQFVRYFGPIRSRTRGGSGAIWMGDELEFCDARHALRLPDWHATRFPPWGDLEYVVRRLFVHRPAAARFEAGVAVFPRQRPLAGAEVLSRLEEFLAVDTVVPVADGKPGAAAAVKRNPLVLQGRPLSRLLLRATVPKEWPTDRPLADWWVRDGEPAAVVEYGTGEVADLSAGTRVVPAAETDGLPLAYTTTGVRGRSVVVWFLGGGPCGPGAGDEDQRVRRLRLCLLRLHLEFQVLRLVLNTIADRPEFEPAPAAAKQLNGYLDESSRRLFTRERFGANQAPLFAALAALRELVPEEKRQLVLDRLDSVRATVRQRVDKLIRSPGPDKTVGAAAGDPRPGEGGTMLPGVEFEEVWKAIRNGYEKDELRRMLKFRLNINLDDVVADGPKQGMVYDLLALAERQGWTADLIRESYRYNPRSRPPRTNWTTHWSGWPARSGTRRPPRRAGPRGRGGAGCRSQRSPRRSPRGCRS
jgi:hypothetical protein